MPFGCWARLREQQEARRLQGGGGRGRPRVPRASRLAPVAGVQEGHAARLARRGIDGHLARDRAGAQREAPGVQGRVDEAGGRVEGGVDVAAARAPAAGAAAEAAAAVLVVLEPVGGHARPVGREHAARARQRLAQLHLGRVEPGRPLEAAVGQVGQALGVAGDAEVEVDLVVVGRDVGVGDGPVLAVAVVALGLEVVVGQAQGEPAPDVRLAAQAARAHPGVVRAGVGVVLLVHHDVLAVVRAAPALHVGVARSSRACPWRRAAGGSCTRSRRRACAVVAACRPRRGWS